MPQAHRLRQVARPRPGTAAGRRGRRGPGASAVLAAACAVVTTSAWTRHRLDELYALPADRVHVAEPGVDAAGLAPGTAAGDALLCVAAVTPDKGHDVLLDALATATDLTWRCACVGSLDRDHAFADGVRRATRKKGLGDRVRFLDRAPAGSSTAHAPTRTCSCSPRAPGRGWRSSPRLARSLPVIAAGSAG